MLGKVFVKHGINLVYGESGFGKTVSTIKALNREDITPILLDFDNNLSPSQNECQYTHIDGPSYLKDKSCCIPNDKVIIVDTWQMFIVNGGSIKELHKIRDANNTVIIIAHNKAIATKQDIPDIDPRYVNHFDSKLYLSYDKGSSVKSKLRPPSFDLTVLKLRGYKGDRVIVNWMRDDSPELLVENWTK